MTYGERLKAAMDHAGITQNELAERVGYSAPEKLRVTQANISKLINQAGIKGSAHTARFARICGVSEDWLAYEEGEMEAPPSYVLSEDAIKVGHAYEALSADKKAAYRVLLGEDVERKDDEQCSPGEPQARYVA